AGVSLAIRKLEIKDDLLLIAGDNYFGFHLDDFVVRYRGVPLLAAYDIEDVREARKFGVVVEKQGRAVEFQEKPAEPKSTLVSAGCYVLPKDLLGEVVKYAKKHADNLGGVFEYFLKKGEEVRVWSFREAWFDIGSFKAYLQAHKYLLDGEKIVDKTALREDSQLRGSVVIGPHVKLINSTVMDSVVLEHTVLEDCVIKNSVIDKKCELRGLDLDHKIMREGTQIKI
ncbi:MAG: sugar phosphate nucleotidyltransferase, partial [Campylobacterales bacterium]